MSDLTFLTIAVAGTFAAVAAASYSLVASSRGRRSARVVQLHLETAGVAVPGTGKGGSLSDRMLEPGFGKAASVVTRLTPAGMVAALDRKVVLAGSPRGWSAGGILMLQFIGVIGGLWAGYAFGVGNGPHGIGPLWIPLLGFLGYTFPVSIVDRKVQARQEQIRRALADTIDLLAISVEAGLAFDAALLHARRTVHGPLSEELGRMLHEMQLGARRVDAMRHLADRTDVAELRSFVLAMVQADVFGVSIANILRAQSLELRTKRRQRAEERAMRIPVKLVFPTVICILPALLAVVVGPGIIRIAENLF
jgi:tight adherence protein C